MPIESLEASPQLARKVTQNTVLVFAGQFFSLAIHLATTVLLARYLGKSDFGNFSFALAWVSVFAVIADFGMKSILVREISRQPEYATLIAGNAVLLKLVLCFLAIVMSTGTALVFDLSTELKVAICILSANILASSKLYTFRIVFESLFHASLRMKIPVVSQILDALILAVTIIALIHFNASFSALTIAYVLSNVPGLILTVVLASKFAKPMYQLDRTVCRMLVQESFPLLAYLFFMGLYDRLDVMLLQAMKDPSVVGLYAAAFRFTAPLHFIPLAIVTSLYPLMSKFSGNSMEKLGKIYSFGMKLLITFGLALGLYAIVWSEQVFEWLFSSEYSQAASAFKFLIWAQAFGFLIFFLVDFNTAIARQAFNLRVALFMAMLNLGFDLALIPKWDVVGASIAKLTTNFAGFGLLFWFSHRQVSLPLGPIAIKFAGVGALFLAWLIATKDLTFALAAFLSIVVYLLLLKLLNVFDANERRLLLQFVGKKSAVGF